MCRCCSDDVDDQYTEKGRLLIRKEGEALANGMRIGEILAADDLEMQLPGMKGRKREHWLDRIGSLSVGRRLAFFPWIMRQLVSW